MATKYPLHSAWTWDETTPVLWCAPLDDNVADTAVPGAADVATLTALSGGGLVVEDIGPVDGLNMTDYAQTLQCSGWTINVDGDVYAEGGVAGPGARLEVAGDFEVAAGTTWSGVITLLNGTGNFNTGGVQIADLTINTAGAIAQTGPSACGFFELTAGTFTGATALDIYGDVTRVAGTVQGHTGQWTLRSGGTVGGWAQNAELKNFAVATGVTAAAAGSVFISGRFTTEAGSMLAGADWRCYPLVNDFCDILGDCTSATLSLYLHGSKTNIGRINAGTGRLQIFDWGIGRTLGQTGNVLGGDIFVWALDAGQVVTFNIAAGNLTATGAVGLGSSTNAGSGVLVLPAGMHSFASLARRHLDNAANALTLAAGAVVRCSGTLDGTGIAVTSAEADVHDGSLKDVGGTGIIRRWGAVADTGCTLDLVHYPSPLGPAVALVAA